MTLRARLTWMLLGTLAPLGLAAAVGLYFFVRMSLTARLDDALEARAEAISAAVKLRDGKVVFDFEDLSTPQYQPRATTDRRQVAFFEIWSLEGERLAGLIQRSPSLERQAGASHLLRGDSAAPEDGTWNGELPDDEDVRVLARRVSPPVEGPEGAEEMPDAVGGTTGTMRVLVVVAVSREPVDGPLGALAIGLGCVAGVLGVVGWAGVRWALERGLAPVRILAEQVSDFDAGDLGSRLAAPDLPPEISPIQDRINGLLARIDAAMQRERRFTTSAAHELRTPVAELRILLEVSASRPRSAAESEATLGQALGSVERLDRLVAALLRLARIESGREPVGGSELALGAAVAEAVGGASALAASRGVRFCVDVPAEMRVRADADLAGLAMANVMANAAEYADAGSRVAISAAESNGSAVLRVENLATATATATSNVDGWRVGEPLWRADPARSATGHLGLGLALARSAVAACGGAMAIARGGGGGGDDGPGVFAVEIRFARVRPNG